MPRCRGWMDAFGDGPPWAISATSRPFALGSSRMASAQVSSCGAVDDSGLGHRPAGRQDAL